MPLMIPDAWVEAHGVSYGAVFDAASFSYSVYITDMDRVWCAQGGKDDVVRELAHACIEDLEDDQLREVFEIVEAMNDVNISVGDECVLSVLLEPLASERYTFHLAAIDATPFLWSLVALLLQATSASQQREQRLFDVIANKDFLMLCFVKTLDTLSPNYVRNLRLTYKARAEGLDAFNPERWQRRMARLEGKRESAPSMTAYRSPTKKRGVESSQSTQELGTVKLEPGEEARDDDSPTKPKRARTE